MSGLLNLKKGVADFGDITGYLDGALITPVVSAASANGAITIPDGGIKIIPVTKAGVCAMTLGVPTTAQNGVILVFFSTTAQAHTLTAATIGFNAGDAAADVATFGGAIGDGLIITAYLGEWYILNSINISLS